MILYQYLLFLDIFLFGLQYLLNEFIIKKNLNKLPENQIKKTE
jgi:hypothetical protein